MHTLRFIISYRSILLLLVCSAVCLVRTQAQTPPFESSDLPVVVLETGGVEIPDDPKIPAVMGIIRGDGERNFLTDLFTDYYGYIGIELRGTSSLDHLQKQYLVNTRDSLGENLNVSLMEFPRENDWILYAPYVDKSLMRNVLVYHMAREMGHYASRTRFCELLIDGEYQGVYVLMEQIKRDKYRVNVSKLEPDIEYGEELTGGYIFSIDHGAKEGDLGWSGAFDSLGYFTYWHVYPKSKHINLNQRWYIQDHMAKFENLMKHPDYADPRQGYGKYIDVASFVDYILINEWANNVDGFIASLYLHKDRSSVDHRIVAGPVWDFNIAFGNVNYWEGDRTTGWRSHYGRIPFWWRRLLQDVTFTTRLEHRWAELRQGVLSDNHVQHVIDSLANHLGEAQQRHFARWELLGANIWPNAFVGDTWEEELDYLESWTLERMAWMDENIGSVAWTGSGTGTSLADRPEVAGNLAMRAYPAPVRDKVTIELRTSSPISGTLVLRDMLGRELRRVDVDVFSGGRKNLDFDLRGVPHGTYTVTLHSTAGIVSHTRVTVLR